MFASLPFIVLSPERLSVLLGFIPDPVLYIRLLGWAWLALCVGYAFGWLDARRGVVPIGTIAMGVVSNAGAAAWLVSAQLLPVAEVAAHDAEHASIMGWTSAGILGAIAVGLIIGWRKAV